MHNEQPSTHHTDTLVSFTLGMAAGAALALVFAPASGRETRTYLANKGRHAAEKGRQWAEQGSTALGEARETVSRRVNDAVEEGKRGYREALHRGQEGLRAASDEVADLARLGE